MKDLSKQQLDALAGWIKDIVVETTEESGDYAEDFARYAAAYAAAVLIDPAPDSMARFRAQARVVAETIREISDQASHRILLRVEEGLRLLIAVAKAAL